MLLKLDRVQLNCQPIKKYVFIGTRIRSGHISGIKEYLRKREIHCLEY